MDPYELPRVTIDQSTIAKLKGLGEVLVFCDEQGNVLGHFEPDHKSPAFREWLRNLDLGISDEEIQRRVERARREGLTTEQVLERLRARGSGTTGRASTGPEEVMDAFEPTRATLDDEVVSKLHGLGEVLVFYDKQGNVLGRFEPDEKSPAFREWLKTLDPGISEEEMRHRESRNGGFTTEQLVTRLRARP